MPTDITEKGLETTIYKYLTGVEGLAHNAEAVGEITLAHGASGYIPGYPKDFDQGHALDVPKLLAFLKSTQVEKFNKFGIADIVIRENIAGQVFLKRISDEIEKRGVIDVLRKGVNHGPLHFDLFFGTPTPGNKTSKDLHAKNLFSITRQLKYSESAKQRALDLCLFINGLPIATFELKNSLTKQTVHDAVEQYRRDRDPREKLFEFGRCAVHFAVDDSEVRMCTELKGKDSWFLPFNKGWNDGAGNPPNPHGIKTDYLWKEILKPISLANIIENYAQITGVKERRTGKIANRQVWPRYHQLEVVRQALAHVLANGAGHRYLIQHSTGSGKSNSIAWLAHQLIGLKSNTGKAIFDSVIVITDRLILDDQIKNTIKSFTQVGATVGHAARSGDLRSYIQSGKKIIITTIQKFPFILNEIDIERNKRFAILIDEAHSSQGGRTTTAVNQALGGNANVQAPAVDAEDSDPEDTVNKALEERIQAHKLLAESSYFAFTATPKNKTLELFGEPLSPDAEGKVKHKPFHLYTMKQAIEEGFILDVLKYFTPVNSYFNLVKKIKDDPEFDTKKAKKKLRKYVEGHQYAIRQKAEIMVDHFLDNVVALGKIGGQARAMVVCNGINMAVNYYHAIRAYLGNLKSPYKAIVAFSGDHEYEGAMVSELSLNGFSSGDIASMFQNDPYRILVCADKFQTGYDEPLLHTMYVDKPLSGIKAVQTLSRLNRAHPQKHDCFMLDFQNNAGAITEAFQDYYRATCLAEETDPNKLNDLKSSLDDAQVYSQDQVDTLVAHFLGGKDRPTLDPILDDCVMKYVTQLNENGQVEFKSKAKAFCRTYAFLSAILSYGSLKWEKLSIFLNLLVPKLPAPIEEDLAKGILEAIDMESYRVEKKAMFGIILQDKDAEIGPVPTETAGFRNEPELDRLSNIIRDFNEKYGTFFTAPERVSKRILEEIAPQVARDPAFLDAKKNTNHNARIAHDLALARVMQQFLNDDTLLYRYFTENEGFKQFVSDMVYSMTGSDFSA